MQCAGADICEPEVDLAIRDKTTSSRRTPTRFPEAAAVHYKLDPSTHGVPGTATSGSSTGVKDRLRTF